jgi:hypothetical protein
MCQASKWGLEISGIAAIDVDNYFALHLEAVQTPGSKVDPDSDETLLDWYGNVLFERRETLSELSSYFVADAFFAKKPFVDKVLAIEMHLISRLRHDADLKYLFYLEKTGKKGRPRKHDGKIDWANLKQDYFNITTQIDELTTVYCAIIYSKSFKRNIKIACKFTNS